MWVILVCAFTNPDYESAVSNEKWADGESLPIACDSPGMSDSNSESKSWVLGR